MKMARITLFLLLLFVPAAFCDEGRVTVTGKTIYKNMGIEDAEIVFFKGDVAKAQIKSGYHGDWIARLPYGSYRLKATGILGDLRIFGEISELLVDEKTKRLDHVLIELKTQY